MTSSNIAPRLRDVARAARDEPITEPARQVLARAYPTGVVQ